MSHTALQAAEHAALTRVLRLARNDTPKARCAADLVLAWWNAPKCGGFDFRLMAMLDGPTRTDMLTVIAYAARAGHGPEVLGFGDELDEIFRMWRPSAEHQRKVTAHHGEGSRP